MTNRELTAMKLSVFGDLSEREVELLRVAGERIERLGEAVERLESQVLAMQLRMDSMGMP